VDWLDYLHRYYGVLRNLKHDTLVASMKITSFKTQMIASIVAGLSGLALCTLLFLELGSTKRDPLLWVSGVASIIISIIGIVRANKARKNG